MERVRWWGEEPERGAGHFAPVISGRLDRYQKSGDGLVVWYLTGWMKESLALKRSSVWAKMRWWLPVK